MPCNSGPYSSELTSSDVRRIIREEKAREEQVINTAKDDLDRVTRYLCAVLTLAEKHFSEPMVNLLITNAEHDADGVEQQEIAQWWIGHKEWDKKREAGETQ